MTLNIHTGMWLLTLLTVMLLASTGHASQSPTFSPSEDNWQPVPAHFAAYWIEEPGYDPQQILQDPGLPWQPVTLSTISAGRAVAPAWFRIPVTNPGPEPMSWLLTAHWSSTYSLHLYIKRANTVEHQFLGIQENGEYIPQEHLQMSYELTLGPHEEVELYFRSASEFFNILPLQIWSPGTYEHETIKLTNWYFLSFGALISLLLYNLSLSVFVRDSTYLYYCFYVACIILYELAFHGIGIMYLWGDSPWMFKNALSLGVYLSFLSGALFFRQFLNVGFYNIWLQRIIDANTVYWCLAILDLLITGNVWSSSLYFALFCCVFALLTPLYLWYLGNPLAKYYLVAWLVLQFFTVLVVLTIVGVLPHHPITIHGQMFGFVLEMLLLSLALAARISLERNQREKAQKESLQLQLEINRQREYTIDVQKKVLRLEKQNNFQLEQRVEERTKTLEQTLKQLSQANQKLEHLTVTDALTGVANRRHFDEVLEKEFKRARRNNQPLSLLLMDLDHFKQLNDTHGHLAGDYCLQQFARTLQTIVNRDSDLVARYGGEEFVVILPQTSAQAAFDIAENLRLAVTKMQILYKETRLQISASIGLVEMQQNNSRSATEMVESADQALYSAKDSGRNRCVAAS